MTEFEGAIDKGQQNHRSETSLPGGETLDVSAKNAGIPAKNALLGSPLADMMKAIATGTTSSPEGGYFTRLMRENRGPQEPKKVSVPEQYKTYVPWTETMVEEDITFFEKTRNKFAIERSTIPQEDHTELEEDVFLSAARDVIAYGKNLRKFEPGIPDEDLDDSVFTGDNKRVSLSIYQSEEKKRKSNERMGALVSLFLHHPQFKGAYRRIHQYKMERALPYIAGTLSKKNMDTITELPHYFEMTQTVLSEGMQLSANTFPEEQRDMMGILTGYQNRGIFLPRPLRTRYFANIGTGTFLHFLEPTIAEAVKKGEPVQDVLRREFLDRDGVGFQLMRMHIFNFTNEVEEDIEDRPLAEQRLVLAATETNPGLCPATLLTSNLNGEKPRPIAYEIATVIAKAIPERLLHKSKNNGTTIYPSTP